MHWFNWQIQPQYLQTLRRQCSRFKLSNLIYWTQYFGKLVLSRVKFQYKMKGKLNFQKFIFSNLTIQSFSSCVQIFQYYSYLKVMAILHPGRTKWRYIFSLFSGIFTRSSFYIIILQCLYDLFSCLNAKALWSMSQQTQCCQNNLSWDSTHVILLSFRGLLLYELGDALTTLAGRQSCRWLDWYYL